MSAAAGYAGASKATLNVKAAVEAAVGTTEGYKS